MDRRDSKDRKEDNKDKKENNKNEEKKLKLSKVVTREMVASKLSGSSQNDEPDVRKDSIAIIKHGASHNVRHSDAVVLHSITENNIRSRLESPHSHIVRAADNTVIVMQDREGSIQFINAHSVFLNTKDRHNFIRRVYSILALMVLLTCTFPLVVKFVPSVSKALKQYWYLVFVAVITDILLIAIINIVNVASRKIVYNIIFMLLIITSHSFLIGCICILCAPNEILLSLAITIVLFILLTLFTFQSKWDITGCTPYILVVILIVAAMLLFCFLFENRILSLVICCCVIFILSTVIVFDTQLLLGGKRHLVVISTEDYTFAAIQLYIDFCVIFVVILSCQGNCGN